MKVRAQRAQYTNIQKIEYSSALKDCEPVRGLIIIWSGAVKNNQKAAAIMGACSKMVSVGTST